MHDAWYVILRDIMVILAAASVIVMSVFVALVAWRLYVIGRELQVELQPVIETMNQTANTVRDSSSFVAGHTVPPPVGAIGVAAGVYQLYVLVRQFSASMKEGNAALAVDALAGDSIEDTGGSL
jgi:hypothetical protein